MEELQTVTTKYERYKKSYTEILKISAQKDLRIAALEKQLQAIQPTDNNEMPASKVDLSPYKEVFSPQQLNQLQNINHEIRFDSTFVRRIILFLYGDKENAEFPSLKKTAKTGDREINQMPQEAINLINQMLSMRLDAVTKKDVDYLNRLQKCNTLISKALYILRQTKQNINLDEY